jgi:DNA adenine methylase
VRPDNIKPFLKWAGGKRWLTGAGVFPEIENYDRYLEPFLGSGAVFFHLRPSRAILSDVNAELIHLYATVREHPGLFRGAMEDHHRKHSRDHYYAIRASKPTDAIARAARFLYLNRTCWNGLYRVNMKGEFNVPIGTKSTVLFPDDDFECIAAALADSELVCSDFETVIDRAGEGDLVFVDPPYTVRHNFNGFLKYNESIFSWADQVRLAECVKTAVDRGAGVIVTNANHDSVRDLYNQRFTYREFTRASVLAASSDKRGLTTEAVFLANV